MVKVSAKELFIRDCGYLLNVIPVAASMLASEAYIRIDDSIWWFTMPDGMTAREHDGAGIMFYSDGSFCRCYGSFLPVGSLGTEEEVLAYINSI